MSDGRELDSDMDPPSWIKDKMTLLVMDGNHGMEYAAITESDPYLVENGWLVDIRYELSGGRDTVGVQQCINLEKRGRASRVRKKTTKQIIRKSNKHKAKIFNRKKKGRGGISRPASRPPSVIDLTSGDRSDTLSLASFSVSEAENVARLPSPEEREDAGFDDLFVGDIDSAAPASFADDDDSDLNKKPAAVSIDTVTTKSTASKSARVNRESEEKKKQKSMKQFQEAKDALSNTTFSAKDVERVLNELGPPYTYLQTATLELQRRQRMNKTREQLELFVVEIGMRIEKPFHGKIYEGVVLCEGDEEVIKNGKLVKVWKVVYEDGDNEELEWDELLRYHVRTPDPDLLNIRGRAMHALELFCGSGVVSQEFRQRYWKVISLDIDEGSNATWVQDILKMKPRDLAFVPDLIWASLPCHTYSCAAGSYHRSARKGQYESSEEARRNNFLFLAMVNIMKWAKQKHPHLVVVIENPVGQLSKMPLMKQFVEEFGLERTTVDYCAFGRSEKKPTHIWTNDKNLIGNLVRYQCSRNCCVNGRHESVQANRSKIDYSVIPQKLAEEVAENLNSKFYQAGLRWEKAASPTDD